ncbi:unnamed protein product [Cuscuta campestris]|uniref:Aminotransferase-like plant mobile domain-containing protein n=1 Tax=Cuscuta campestris TaxID=132261 RepID=A0A484NEI0_9ASTE|nr:unnamed protein product [Cuscuta campestris]
MSAILLLPDPLFFLSRSVPLLAAMIVSDSDSATPSSHSRQADQSASGCNPGHTQSPQPSPSAVSGHKRRRLRKQFPSSTPVDEGSRVELDENIMALCHCQITDWGFADATDMVGPSIEVLRPTSTQTALDAPSGFLTVHLASLKKGLRFPLHPLLVEFLNVVDLLPCQLVPNSHRYIAGYLVRWCPSFRRVPCPPPDATLVSITRQVCNKGVLSIKEVVTEETLTGLGFEFAQDELRHQPDLLRDIPGGHHPDQLKDIPEEGLDCGPFGEEMDGELLLNRFTARRKTKREAKSQGKRSSSHREESPPREPAVIVVEDQNEAALEVEDQARISAGSEDDLDNMVLLRLSQETGSLSRLGRSDEGSRGQADGVARRGRCAALEMEKASQEDRCVALEADKALLSSEVESVSARVVELEGEKSDLIQQLERERSDRVRHAEEAVESFKSSPDFTMVAMERMDKLTAAWLQTEPGAQWMVKEGTKSFNCGLFRAQQVFPTLASPLPAAPWPSSTPVLTWTEGARAPLKEKKKKEKKMVQATRIRGLA